MQRLAGPARSLGGRQPAACCLQPQVVQLRYHPRAALPLPAQQPAISLLTKQGALQQKQQQQQRQQVRTFAAAADGAVPAPSPKQGTSTFVQAVFNVVNVMMGVGLLSLPFALKSSGWVGIVLLWVMGIVTNYTGKALVECANTVVKQQGLPAGTVLSYEDIVEAAFGKLGRFIVSSIIYVELFGTCALLFILEGDNLFKLFGTSIASSPSMYMLLAALVMIPTVWLPDLGALAFLGAAGITATCTVTASVAYTLLSGSFAPGAVTHVANWATLPLVFGIMTFCYSGHGVFPSIQASMKDPQEFPRVLNTAFIIVAVMCTLMGAAGYYMYGTGSLDLVTFNLPLLLANACASIILVNPIAKFALTMEPVAAAAAAATRAASGFPRLALRTAVAIAILLAARSLPFLAYLMALVGSFMTISVSVTFPALCHLVLHKGASSTGRVAWNYFVAVLGLLCTIFGTAASMKSLAAKAASVAAGGA